MGILVLVALFPLKLQLHYSRMAGYELDAHNVASNPLKYGGIGRGFWDSCLG
jgi:hypothetical protein